MNHIPEIDVTTSVSQLRLRADVSLATPLLKRALLSDIAAAVEHNYELQYTRAQFLDSVADTIRTDGTDSLSRLTAPECQKFPGGYEALLQHTTLMWQQLFGEALDAHYTVEVTVALDTADLIRAYACACVVGIVDRCEDPPDSCNASTILGYAAQAYIDFGANWIGA
jgi:hypothetical protein